MTAEERDENAMLAVEEYEAPGASWDELEQLAALDSLRSERAEGERNAWC